MPDTPTTPTTPPPHGSAPRGLETTPSSHVYSGRFGRMFRNLPTYDIDPVHLAKLGAAMIQGLEDGKLDKPLGEVDDDENISQRNGELRLPAGYTYFGQFVDHDITFDPVSSLTRQDDPDALVNFRTPRFDLDSLYGRGPADQPYMYSDGIHLTLGLELSNNPGRVTPDLQRVPSGRAIIGDPRNDENLIVSQLQVAMLRFANAVVDVVGAAHPEWSKEDVFKQAQQQTRWHYQWVVIHDFLPRIVGDEVVDSILKPSKYDTSPALSPKPATTKPDLRFYKWHESPYMPIEFSVAAYRFGHTMIRPSYLINEVAVASPPVEGASRIPLFQRFDSELQSLKGFRPLPADWGVQWNFFLPHIDGFEGAANLPQPSYKIDTELSHPLGALPDSTAGPEQLVAGFDPSIAQMLAVRNLLRGQRLGLPTGEDVAKTMGITPLTPADLFDPAKLDAEVITALSGRTPLWYYILKEAESKADSAHLGPVGGRIVAEVLIGLLSGDPMSYLSVDPTWGPTLPSREAGEFTLSDIINIAVPPPATPPIAPSYSG